MRHRRLAAIAIAVAAIVALVAVATSERRAHGGRTGKPIVIGAAIDLTKNMAPFDAPALEAAQIEIKKINAAGGVNGRPLEIKPLNDQLDPTQTKSDATQARRARASTSAGSPATSTTRRRRSPSSWRPSC